MSFTKVCKDCTERHTACWSSCERHQEERKAFDEKKEAIKKQKREEHVAKEVLFRYEKYRAKEKVRYPK